MFLALLERHADAVVGAEDSSSRAAAEYASAGDGGAAAAAGADRARRGPAALLQRLLAPLRLGQEEVVPALGKLGSAVAVSNLQQVRPACCAASAGARARLCAYPACLCRASLLSTLPGCLAAACPCAHTALVPPCTPPRPC